MTVSPPPKVRRYHSNSFERRRTHLADFMAADNFAR